MQHHTTDETMNNLNANNMGSFICIHTIVENVITSDRKREILTGVYVCDNDDGETAALNTFLGRKNLEFNLMLTCASRHPTSIPEEITHDVTRSSNQNHIATRTMQSLIFPPNTVSDILNADHCHHRNMTPCSLYACIRGIIKLGNKLDPNIVFGLAIAINNTNTNTVNIVYFPPQNFPPPNNKPQVLLPLPAPTQSSLSNEIVLRQIEVQERNLRVSLGNRTQSQDFSKNMVQHSFICI